MAHVIKDELNRLQDRGWRTMLTDEQEYLFEKGIDSDPNARDLDYPYDSNEDHATLARFRKDIENELMVRVDIKQEEGGVVIQKPLRKLMV